MASNEMDQEIVQLVLELQRVDAIKFGNFKLKSGIMSPVYVDLRVLVSHPMLLDRIANELLKVTKECQYDLMVGVPYTALPFATVMSSKNKVPMLMIRKEVKAYGTKKQIEGIYEKGQTILIVEDLVTSGLSVFETVAPLEKEGLIVKDVVVLLDRGQGGKQNVIGRGKNLHSVLTLPQILTILKAHGKVEDAMVDSVLKFLKDNQVKVDFSDTGSITAKLEPTAKKAKKSRFSYQERAGVAKNAIGKKLFETIEAKKSNLCVAADVTTSAELVKLATAVGPFICCLKTHCDIVTDWTSSTATKLQELSKEHNFLIFEDRKFADIGNTVVNQCSQGYHKISSWADFVNAHSLPGAGIVDGLKLAMPANSGLLLLAEMSSKGNLIDANYTAKTLAMAVENDDFCFGFISQSKLRELETPEPFVYMTPGVKMQQEGDNLGQQYNTPEAVIGEKGCDVAIVGRGIYKSEDPATAAAEYSKACWTAYEKRL